MAANPAAARLTETYRLAQARLGAQTVQQILLTWPLLDPSRIDQTITSWLRVSIPIVQTQRSTSAVLASSYLRLFRALEVGADGEFIPTLADMVDLAAVTTSLTVTGPVRVKRSVKQGVAFEAAVEAARVSVARAAMRHVLDGGRNTIIRTVEHDPLALGYARATNGHACFFCAMLASRGPVYKQDSFAHSDARFTGFGDVKVHDGCHCSMEPVYDQDAPWPAGSRHYHDLWDRVTAAAEGPDAARLAFRHAIEQ